MVHEPGHPEPWIIALSAAPTTHRAFDYGLRWGIEAMFADVKTRGFGIADSHIRLPGRRDHLILVMALALSWAVSTGMPPTAPPPPKKHPGQRPRNDARTLTSFFTRGIRRTQTGLQRAWTLPPRWNAWAN